MRRRTRNRDGISKLAAGVIAIVVLVLFCYGAYTKFANPFASRFTIHAVFSSANGLLPDAPVRIAGVNVGKVTHVGGVSGCRHAGSAQSSCQASEVTMEIENEGLPLHKDATFWIRPRTFLEGNFFVDVSPGTPSAPLAPDGFTFPIQQGRESVQLDQVLTSLQPDTRYNLQVLLQQYGSAVKQAGPSFNASIQYWLPAYEYSSIVAHDALGIQPNDLSNALYSGGTVAGAFDAHPQKLQNLITNFNTTAGAFARQNVALERAVAELPRTLAAATPAFNALNAAFPPLNTLAHALIPGVQSTGSMIDASLPFITQLQLLVQPSELQGLASDLSTAIPPLAKLAQETIPVMQNGVRPASSCVANEVYPWSQLTLNDPNFNASNGFPPRKVYVEAVNFLPGLAGETRNFDGNGPYIRVIGPGGPLIYSLAPGAFGRTVAPLSSTQPALPPGGTRPPLEPNVPCETQPAIATLSTPSGPSLTPIAAPATP